MLDLQYEIPNRTSDVASLTVTKGAVEGTEKPLVETGAKAYGAE